MGSRSMKIWVGTLILGVGTSVPAATALTQGDEMPLQYGAASAGSVTSQAVPGDIVGTSATEPSASSRPRSMPPRVYHGPGGRRGVSFQEAVPGVAPSTVARQRIAAPRRGDCTPKSGRDNPHRSATGFAVSGHGWWDKGTCTAATARVYNCLYEWYTDGTWRRKACSTVAELRPYSAGGGRRTARQDCSSNPQTSWRNHVDVDVVGKGDTSEWPFNSAEVNCRYYGPDE